jgi:hypothetical protein
MTSLRRSFSHAFSKEASNVKKEWLLTFGIVVFTAFVTLGTIRFFAPHLLGVSKDLQLVRVAKKVPPFFDNVFRKQDYESAELTVQDPFIKRGRPLFNAEFGVGQGPHDILGFRNRAVPNAADVVVIGDSTTYGYNVILAQNWPSRMREALGRKRPMVYNMSVAGWGAAEYLAIFDKALVFRPRAVVVAFHSGNDPLETFQQAYGNPYYALLQTASGLKMEDIPRVAYPPPKSDWWPVKFKDGVSTIFTPKLRLLTANQKHPVIQAGWDGMAKAARVMGRLAREHHVKLVFTVIPTKELVYADKVAQEGLVPPEDYASLVRDESENILRFRRELEKIPGAVFVDVVAPLREAAKRATPLYPEDINSHPAEAGYEVIGRAVAAQMAPLLPEPLEGLVELRRDRQAPRIYLLRDGKAWFAPSKDILRRNGWMLENIRSIAESEITRFELAGRVDKVDPARFGPR